MGWNHLKVKTETKYKKGLQREREDKVYMNIDKYYKYKSLSLFLLGDLLRFF